MQQSAVRRQCVWLVLLAGLSACASSLRGPAEPEDQTGTRIVVRNLAWCDVRVFAVRRSFGHRVGMVTSMHTTTFTLPEDLVDGHRVQLHLVPVGRSDTFTTDPIVVADDQALHLTVQEPIRLSTYATRGR